MYVQEPGWATPSIIPVALLSTTNDAILVMKGPTQTKDTPPALITFEDHITRFPEVLRRLTGRISYNNLPHLDDKPRSFTVATDGTITDGCGGVVVVLVDSMGNKLRSYLPVDGNHEQMDSFLTELSGILASLLIIRALLATIGRRMHPNLITIL